jgi:hypothetical protein
MLCAISPEMLKYIRDTTNKSIEKYKRPFSYINVGEDKPNLYSLLPFVSFVSFLAGYNFHIFIMKNVKV